MDRLGHFKGQIEKKRYQTGSPEATIAFGEALGRSLPRGAAVSLEGGLGAGKTCMVKGIVRGAGIKSEVLSPTFILLEEYRGDPPVFHYDLYRLEDLDEVEKIGLFDSVDGRNIVIVEWGDRLPAGALEFDVRIRITITGKDSREILVEAPANLMPRLDGEGADG
jgi:tRNA threonylcarbamoyladenosine biosynthesis protein TsaE